MADNSSFVAASATLTSVCARTLRNTHDPDVAALVFSAILALVDPQYEPPPTSGDIEECTAITEYLDETLRLEPRSSLSAAFARHHYARWAATLLDVGLLNWRAALPAAAVSTIFDGQVLRAPPREALEALVTALGTPSELESPLHDHRAHERRMSTCASLVASMLRSQRVRLLLVEHLQAARHSDDDDEALIALLVTLPTRVANALRAPPPAVLAPAPYYAALTTNLLEAILANGGPSKRMPPHGASFGGKLLGRIARLGHFASVLPALCATDGHRAVDGSSHSTVLIAAMPAGSVEAAVEAGVLHASSGALDASALCTLYLPLLRASSAARIVVGERLLLLRILPLASVPPLIQLLVAVGVDALRESLLAVCEVWSSASHVSRASLRQQQYLSTILLEGLRALPAEEVDAADGLVRPLLGGVQQHLGAPGEATRRLGMRVAEALSRIIDPENPLDFEAGSDDDEEEADASVGEAAGAAASAKPSQDMIPATVTQSTRRRGKARRAKGSDDEQVDPDAPVRLPGLAVAGAGDDAGDDEEEDEEEGDEEEASDESDGSDDSYEAFDLSDDRSDLKAAPRPRHLRRLLAGLRAKDGEHEAVNAALDAAADLVRSAVDAPELHTMAAPLLRALLHLPDRYKLPRFAELRHDALVALAVRAPAAAANFLTAEFYSEHVTLEMRMQSLRAVHAMADELAAPPPRPSAAEAAASEAAAAAVRPVGKTRRWGSSHTRAPPAPAAASLLGAVAPRFFFPLLGRYDDPANTFKLLTEDCFLLEALLHALSALLRGAAVYACARSMAAALFELSWTLRLHDEAAVRRGVLVALCTVGRSMLPAVVLVDYERALPELQDWLRVCAAEDADDSCRQLAAACHAIYGNAIRSEMRLDELSQLG